MVKAWRNLSAGSPPVNTFPKKRKTPRRKNERIHTERGIYRSEKVNGQNPVKNQRTDGFFIFVPLHFFVADGTGI
jgi:hypothetical protein